MDEYKVIAEGKGKVRLYLNDPLIMRELKVQYVKRAESKELEGLIKLPIPITLEGKVVVAKKEGEGTTHIFFTHDEPDFIPIFFDLESSKLTKKL